MTDFGKSFAEKASVMLIAVCTALPWQGVVAAPQTAPAPSAPPARPVQPLANPNIDQFNVYVRNGSFQAQPVLAAPYSRAMSFADCAGRSIKALRILSSDFGSQEEGRLVDQTVRRSLRCGESAGGVPVFLMRAAMAESLLKREKSLAPVSDGSRAEFPAIDANVAPVLASAIRVAQCQVVRDATSARAVLETRPGSAEERAAEGKLSAATPQCGGQTIGAELDSVAHRAMIASALGGQVARSSAKD